MKLKMKLKCLIVILVILGMLVMLGNFRWEHLESNEEFSYKYDRWAGQTWAEYIFPLATTNGIEIPLIYVDKISVNEIEPYLTKHALSGVLVEKWIERTKLSDIHKGLLIADSLALLINLVYIVLELGRRKDKKFS
jgi:hypothetical protein